MNNMDVYIDALNELADRLFGSVLYDHLVSFDLSDVKFEEEELA